GKGGHEGEGEARGRDVEPRRGGGAVMSGPRDAVLGTIRAALRDVPRDESPEDVVVVRSYRRVDPSPRAEKVRQFVERVSEYKAVVRRASPAELPRAIAEACA